MLIIQLLVKMIHFHFIICMLFRLLFCKIQTPMTNDLWSWGNLQKDSGYLENNARILQIPPSMNTLYLDTTVGNRA